MSDTNDAGELLIIKKRASLDDGAHKGGVWKIAYADFMTAMMAFFLVMWLINAANEETKVQVASYFNPVRLVDSKPQPRGLQEIKDDHETETPEDAKGTRPAVQSSTQDDHQEAPPPDAGKPGTPAHEAALMRDPLGAFDRIAGVANVDRGSIQGLDPFAPAHWKLETPPDGEKSDSRLSAAEDTAARGAPTVADADHNRIKDADNEPVAQKESLADPPTKEFSGKGNGGSGENSLEALKAEIQKALAVDLGSAHPGVSVEITRDGLLVSLTDSADFGMFAIASAEPSKQTVALMERLARVLRERDAVIYVRGHTDARPFKSDVYDNWRLSTARAHMAAYMLERGGVSDKKIARIEGYADRKLKRPDDPEADENRRIELLVAPEKSP